MYERFTDRARKVMSLANQEAHRLNHEYIGTEHILLGLLKEGGGTGMTYLGALGVNGTKVQLDVEKTIVPGPDVISLGKLPQTPRARKVIEYAMEEARSLNHNYVGTEHLMLGLIRESEGVAGVILKQHGVTLEAAKALIQPEERRAVPEVGTIACTASDRIQINAGASGVHEATGEQWIEWKRKAEQLERLVLEFSRFLAESKGGAS
jgi:ATP-dependent Clp protease ATP-binding subunit ClpA